MNNLITAFLDDYYQNPDPQYAVFLKGKWGCGKTYFIKKWLKRYQGGDANDEEAIAITLKPIYVSLYGMNTISEIKTALDREINPFFYSKTGKILKGVAKIIGKVVLKTSIDFNGDGEKDASFSGSVDSLSVFHSKDNIVTGEKLIVFDDIERCHVDIKSLLGFINYFVEHCGCHVVVVGDESQIEQERRKALDEFREKTIGREFSIGPDTEEAVDYFLSEPHISDYLVKERDYIIKCFNSAGNENLRILRQCLMDFTTQIVHLNERQLRTKNLFLHGLLGSFIAVYAELNSKENRDLFVDYAKFFQVAASGLDGENGKKLRSLNQKYNEISQGCLYHTLSVEYVHGIVNHITKGISLVDYITQHINDSYKSFASWERLSGFWELNNKDFDTLYKEVMQAIIDDKIQLPYQLGNTIGYMGYFDVSEVKAITKTNLNLIKRNLRNKINSVPDLESLYQMRNSLIQGMNYVRVSVGVEDIPVMTECLATIQKTFNRKQRTLPDEMQQALRTLSENNVYVLNEIDNKSYPDHSSAYQMKAIFEHEDATQIYNSLCALTNKGRNYFCTFLSSHYLFGASLVDYGQIYAPDRKVLTKLEKMINGAKQSAKGVDKLSYQRLDEALLKAISRSEGDGKPLE